MDGFTLLRHHYGQMDVHNTYREGGLIMGEKNQNIDW